MYPHGFFVNMQWNLFEVEKHQEVPIFAGLELFCLSSLLKFKVTAISTLREIIGGIFRNENIPRNCSTKTE